MSADRRTPTPGSPTIQPGGTYADDVNEEVADLNNRTITRLVNVSGNNDITADCTPPLDAYALSQTYILTPVSNNTGPVRVNIGNRGNKSLLAADSSPLVEDDLVVGLDVAFSYNGTAFKLLGSAAGLAAEKAARIARDDALQAEIDGFMVTGGSLTDSVLLQTRVEDRDLSAPPGSPPAGAVYIVGPTATGAWAGKENNLAQKVSGTWIFVAPADGYRAWVKDEEVHVVYDDAGWTPITDGNLPSVAYALATDIPLGVSQINVMGYWSADEGARMSFRRTFDAPASGIWFQSADLDGYWVYVPEQGRINMRCAGLRFDGGADQVATSTTSTAAGTGSKTFTTQSGKDFRVGDYVRITRNDFPGAGVIYMTKNSLDADTSQANGTKGWVVSGSTVAWQGIYTSSAGVWTQTWKRVWKMGVVTAYSGTSLTVNVTADNNPDSATLATWKIEIDDTPRLQALVTAYPDGANFFLDGPTTDLAKFGSIGVAGWSPDTPYDSYSLTFNGRITTPEGEGFDGPPRGEVRGIGGGPEIQFGTNRGASVKGSETSPWALRILTAGLKRYDHVIVEPPKYMGWFADGTVGLNSLDTLIDCSCQARESEPLSMPYVRSNASWARHHNCVFSAASDQKYAIYLFNVAGAVDDSHTGLLWFDYLRLVHGGILQKSEVATNLGNLFIKDCLTEAFIDGADLLTFDLMSSATNIVTVIDNPSFNDNPPNNYLLNSIGPGIVRGVVVLNENLVQTKLVRLTSNSIRCIHDAGFNAFRTTVPTPAAFPLSNPHNEFTRHFPGLGWQGRNLSDRAGPLVLPRAPLPVKQDPADWTSIFITSGLSVVTSGVKDILGGAYGAKIAGSVNGSAHVYNANNTVETGDMFVVACGVQQLTAGKLPSLPSFSLSAGGYALDGGSASTAIGKDNDQAFIDDASWKWLVDFFVVTAGTGTTGIVLSFPRNTNTEYDATAFCFPIIIHFPASEGWIASEVIAFSHKLGPCRTDGLAGDFTMPLGARLLAPKLSVKGIATADPHVVGQVWSNSGIMTVSAG